MKSLNSPSAIVHQDYDPAALPEALKDWTRFVCISDSHSHTFPVPPGDVLLHSGDLTNTGTLRDFDKTMNWLYQLPHKLKIIIAGNHDLLLHEGWYESNYRRWHKTLGIQPREEILQLLKGPDAVRSGIVYLQNESHTFQTREGGKTWSVYGSPWTPDFHNWAFNYKREHAEEIISKFPKTDILLTHGPAYQIFDWTNSENWAGCEALAAHLPRLRPRLHAVGHIHEARGAYIHDWHASGGAVPQVQSDEGDWDEDDRPTTTTMEGTDTTVFVNAANWPSRNSWQNGERPRFGGFGCQPIVVDLRE